MINYRGIELDRTAYDRDIPKVATMLKDGGGVLISTCPTREAVKRGWVCALLPPVSWGGPPQRDAKQFDRAAPLRAGTDAGRPFGLNLTSLVRSVR
jgi:hypothetical protein